MVKLAIVAPTKNAVTETFIRAQIDRLPADVKVLFGGAAYRFYYGDEPLLKDTSWRRLLRKAFSRARRLPWYHFEQRVLRQFLACEGIEVVLAQYGNIGVLLKDPCHELGIPLVVHYHGVDAYDRGLLNQLRDQYLDLFQKCAAIVVVSRDMVQQLINLGAPRSKIFYNPYGVDLENFRGADPEHSQENFLAVGRFVEKKAPYLTLLSFSKVYAARKQARLIFIGDGPLLPVCKNMAAALDIASAVEFLGAQPHDEVVNQMRRARAFVQHSVVAENGDSEGTPVAVIEACASGLPTVATRHKGIRDVVVEGETGLLVDEGDVENMAHAMIRLAKDAQLAAKMGQAGRRRIGEHYSMEKSIDNLWKIIKASIENERVGLVAH